MDLIYTNATRKDTGVLTAYAFDLSYGATENNFEIILGANEAVLEKKSYIYIEGTEYGGSVDGIKASTGGETVAYIGRTWHGIVNSKVIEPDAGADYLIVSGDANEVLRMLINRLGLTGLFIASESPSGVNIPRYQFVRYCKAYDGIRAMLAANGAKLRIAWKNRAVLISSVPIADYTESPIDGDIATLSVEQNRAKVNHLICLGRGDLAARDVVHLYVDQFGNIVDTPYYTGLDEVTEIYENTSAESVDALRESGIEEFKKIRNVDKAEVSVAEHTGLIYDIGDIVGATELRTGTTVAAAVTQKIVKINNGAISTEYKTGG